MQKILPKDDKINANEVMWPWNPPPPPKKEEHREKRLN